MNYNMLCSPTLTNEQIRFCSTYLTGIPHDIEQLSHIEFRNRICEKFGILTDELADGLNNFRLFCNDITCIHCGIRYEITEPLAFHSLPSAWNNWTCKGCSDFLKHSFDYTQLLDWYPLSHPNSNNDDEFISPW